MADNIVYRALINAFFGRARQQDINRAGFGRVELFEVPLPPDWPQFGLCLAAGWLRKGWRGGIAHTRLEP